MPESITTLPSELIYKVFGNLEHIGTATNLSQTCRRMYDVWRAHRHVLSMSLAPYHPVFWRYSESTTSDETATSLWQLALDYDDALGGKFSSSVLLWASNLHISDGNKDGFATAKRIVQTAGAFRAVARGVDLQICTYSDGNGEARWPAKFQEKQYAIGRMLYKFLTRIITGQFERLAGPRIPDRAPLMDDSIEGDNLWEFAAFVANHPELVPDGFPDLGGMINPENLSANERRRYQNGWYRVVMEAIRNDYHYLHSMRDVCVFMRFLGW
jgi:hypothetical protein